MRPISSASEMNSAGETWPRVGWFQRSRASKPPIRFVLQIEDRLIVDFELAVTERVAQVQLQRAAHLQTRVHLGLEEPPGCAAVGFRQVERHIGILQQLVEAVPSPGAIEMPTLTLIVRRWPSIS